MSEEEVFFDAVEDVAKEAGVEIPGEAATEKAENKLAQDVGMRPKAPSNAAPPSGDPPPSSKPSLISRFGKAVDKGYWVADKAVKLTVGYDIAKQVYNKATGDSTMHSTPSDYSQPPSIPTVDSVTNNYNFYGGQGAGVPRYPHEPVIRGRRPKSHKTHRRKR